MQFGGSWQRNKVNPYNFAGQFPTVTFGFSSAAPADLQLNSAQFPGGIAAADLTRANAMAAFLGGVVSQTAQTHAAGMHHSFEERGPLFQGARPQTDRVPTPSNTPETERFRRRFARQNLRRNPPIATRVNRSHQMCACPSAFAGAMILSGSAVQAKGFG